MKGVVHFPNLATLSVFLGLLSPVKGDFKMTHLSTVFLPSADTQELKYNGGAVEQIAYDPVRKLIYAAGSGVFHVINAKDPNNLKIEQSKYEENADFTDIEVCGDHVFMTSRNMADKSKGYLRVYKRFAKGDEDSLRKVVETEVGPTPDMVYVLNYCRTAIVAVEGQIYGAATDPKGQIAVVKLTKDNDETKATVTSLGFEGFDDKYELLEPFGVRFVHRENNNKFSNDIEPEYVAVDKDERKAYVVLQENNAIAEVDLETKKITSIRGLGYKEWGYLDASDRDSGTRITYWPIRAWYTPDAVQFHQWHGRKLLFTANEGSTRPIPAEGIYETVKGQDIPLSSFGPDISTLIKTSVQDETKLGWLTFSKDDGKSKSGNYSNLYTIGGRSFSIWDVTSTSDDTTSGLTQVFDSGSQFEEMTALYCPHLFNRNGDTVDGTSPSKGPEPESITVGELSGRLYIFIGNEKPGTVMVYSLGRDVTKTRFETIFCDGIPDSSKTLQEMFQDGDVYGLDPEDVRFYDAAKSPTGRPVLMMIGAISGSVSLLDIQAKNDCNLDPDSYCSDGVITAGSLLLTSLCVLLHLM